MDELRGHRRLIAALLIRAVRDAFSGDEKAWDWLRRSPQAAKYGAWVGIDDMAAFVLKMRQMPYYLRVRWMLYR